MSVRLRSAASCACSLLLLLALGCAGSPPASTPPLHSPYFVSRDGNVQYRLPAGWFDVTTDTLDTDRAIWLVRGDYAGSLTVREIHLDAAARADLEHGGLQQVGRLAASLETGAKSGMLAREPEVLRLNGNEGYMYEVEYGSGDRVRTVLFDTGLRLYAVSALVSGGAPPGALKEIFAVLQAFAVQLRW